MCDQGLQQPTTKEVGVIIYGIYVIHQYWNHTSKINYNHKITLQFFSKDFDFSIIDGGRWAKKSSLASFSYDICIFKPTLLV